VRLQQDIELWSGALGRDSAVSIAFLGDNVYPTGVHDESDPSFAADTARLWNQIRLVAGPAALEHQTAAWFIAGNHDWGNQRSEGGLVRLVNQGEELTRARLMGPKVMLLPPAGVPGPVVRDVRNNVRIIFIDTNWFLVRPPVSQQIEFFDRIEEALRSAGDRDIIVAAHHPWETAGPHGVIEGGRAFGLYYLLEKSGTLVQDLNSPVYKDFIRRFRLRVDAVGRPPLVWAAGHDHSLQVFGGSFEDDPVHVLVSGAGSKLTTVTSLEGLRYAASRPGYRMLVFRKDDSVNLFVVAGSADHLLCPGDDEAARATCMDEGLAAFETVYSGVPREPVVDVRPEAEDPAAAEEAVEADDAAAQEQDTVDEPAAPPSDDPNPPDNQEPSP
jgi:hypothetical protein